jgi:hypothetical protein
MALNGDALGDLLATAAGVHDNKAALASYKALANTLVSYLIAHVEVNTTVTTTIGTASANVISAPSVAVVTGATSGTGTGGIT